MKFIYPFLLIALLTSYSNIVYCQNIRLSEAEIQVQEQFVEAHSKMVSGKTDDAIKIYQELLIKSKTCDACAYELSKIYETKGDNIKSIEYAAKAATIDPSNSWYQYLLADLYTKNNKDNEAAKVYANLLLKNIYDKELSLRYAFSLVRAGEPDKALKVYEDLEKKFGINEDFSQRKHIIFIAKNDIPKATLELQKLIDKFPTQIQYKYLLADFYENYNQKSKAIETYKKIVSLSPKETDALLKLKKLENTATNDDQLTLLKGTIENEEIGLDNRIKLLIPSINKLATRYEPNLSNQLIAYADFLISHHASDTKANALAGDIYYHSNKVMDAIGFYKKSVAVNKTVFPIWEQLIIATSESGNYADLIKITNEVIELYPFQPIAFLYNGIANSKSNKYDAALESLQQAIMVSGKNLPIKSESMTEIANIQALQNKWTESKSTYKKAIDILPGNPLSYIRYAKALVHQKQMDEVQENIGYAMKNGGESNPMVLNDYGDIFFMLNQTDKAIEYWTKAKATGNKSLLLDKKIMDKKIYE
jgi:tetratricopeptide (TPR) repeat protein